MASGLRMNTKNRHRMVKDLRVGARRYMYRKEMVEDMKMRTTKIVI